VSGVVSLRLRAAVPATVEADRLAPDRSAAMSEAEIARLPLWVGRRQASVGDFFTVRGGRSEHLRLEGDLSRLDGLGTGMRHGTLVIDGNAGRRVAAGMSGGLVEVLGSVGDAAGLAMQGGALRVRGDAGDDLGAAEPGVARGMAGGEIVVRGSAGASAATRLRRGVVAVAGDLGARGGDGMIAGTLVVLGRSGPGAGRGSRRGSIVACGAVEIPVTYRYACTFEPAWVRLLLTWLHRHHGLPLADALRDGRYRRYCGDAGPPGRGEILVLDRERVEHS
jgi:formylmethanofuran dehydrogenase subunit C